MSKSLRYVTSAMVAVAGIVVIVATARAETATLQMKRLEFTTRYGASPSASDYLFRYTSSQSFFTQTGGEGRILVPSAQSGTGTKPFSEVISKELPEYQAEHPFRGVAKLGTQQFGFVLDSKDKDAKGYDRLYFDLNHNGDLTDDGVIEAVAPRGVVLGSTSTNREFPRVDLTIETDGTKMDYAFFFQVYSYSGGSMTYASASLNAAAYREGEITLDGKTRRVVLLDFNSNGRFDDETAINTSVRSADRQVYPQYGDMLLVDPDPNTRGYSSPYDPSTSDYLHHMAKLVSIDGQLYDVAVASSGEKLTLSPSSAPVGYVTNPNQGFRAVVYSDKGFLKIGGGKSERVPVPEGDWKLLSYTIDLTGAPKPAGEPEKEKERSVMQLLADALVSSAASAGQAVSGPRYTLVSARATGDYQPVKVRRGETVAMPFGPPYNLVVKVAPGPRGQHQVSLGLSVVGAAGEVCSNMMVDGKRPDKPEFTITTADGKEVEKGEFEYG